MVMEVAKTAWMGKKDIRRCHRKNSSGVFCIILLLYGVDPKEEHIEASIEGEPDQVEGEEVKVEADHAFPPEVFQNLGPEGDRPGNKVNPANYIADKLYCLRFHDSHPDEPLFCVCEVVGGVGDNVDMAGEAGRLHRDLHARVHPQAHIFHRLQEILGSVLKSKGDPDGAGGRLRGIRP